MRILVTDLDWKKMQPIADAAIAAARGDSSYARAQDGEETFCLLIQTAIAYAAKAAPEFGPHRERWYLAAIGALAEATDRSL